MKIGDLFSAFKISAAGLYAEKSQLQITAENIANANTTRTQDGKPYRRKALVRKAIEQRPIFSNFLKRARVHLRTSNPYHISSGTDERNSTVSKEFTKIELDVTEKNQTKKIYDPNHPDADEEGFVEYPDINVVSEMLELISASRAYEANLTVMEAAKRLARRSLEI